MVVLGHNLYQIDCHIHVIISPHLFHVVLNCLAYYVMYVLVVLKTNNHLYKKLTPTTTYNHFIDQSTCNPLTWSTVHKINDSSSPGSREKLGQLFVRVDGR